MPDSSALPGGRAVRVAAANDYDLIVAGVAALLADFSDEIEVCDALLVGEPVHNGPIDVVLYDTYGRAGVTADALVELKAHEEIRNVAVFSLDISPALIDDALAAGARGVISKSLSGPSIRDAIVRIAGGEEVVAVADAGSPVLDDLDWPGKAEGLTERESQVLVLVAEGLTNKEIATALYLGVETVKTHVRQVLAKLNLRNRVEATRYVVASGAFSRFTPASSAARR
jgi:DNA-binding NarL/FixJ family response regulator